MHTVEKSWNEYWAAYWRIEQRHAIPGIFEWDRKLVAFIEAVLELSPGQRILDLACGGGDQAKLFARKGYDVVGVDIAPALVAYAREQVAAEGLAGTFLIGDMREITYDREFDACTILSGSFGFFGDAEDASLLRSIHRALKPGGTVFIMYLSATAQTPGRRRTWSEDDEAWVLREHWFEPHGCLYRSYTTIIRKDGTVIVPKPEPGYHANETIRCYTLPEMRTMLSTAGLTFLGAYSDSDADLSLPARPLSPEDDVSIVTARRGG